MIRCFLKSDLFLSINLRISDSLSQSFENLQQFIKRSVVPATSSGCEVRPSVADNLTSNSLEFYGKSYVISTSFEWRLLKKKSKTALVPIGGAADWPGGRDLEFNRSYCKLQYKACKNKLNHLIRIK